MKNAEFYKRRRPNNLITAASICARGYKRSIFINWLLPGQNVLRSEKILNLLYEKESEVNNARILKRASYSLKRHIGLLAAIICEEYKNTPSH